MLSAPQERPDFSGRLLDSSSRLLLLCAGLRVCIVLLVVDIPGSGVLFFVNLLLLALRQLATVGCAVRLHLLINTALLVLELGGFAGSQLAALDALRDALLLIGLALPDFALAVVLRRGVVLVVIDLLRKLILLLVDLLLLRARQLAAVGRAIRPRFAVDGRFFILEIGGLAGCKLSALDSVRDPVLLILLTLRDAGLTLIRSR